MARIIIGCVLAGLCVLIAKYGNWRPNPYLSGWIYAQDATMQLFVVCVGFGIGLLTKRPVLWGALISLCGIAACFAVAEWIEFICVHRERPF